MVEITSEEQNKVKRMKRAEDSLKDLWDNIKCANQWQPTPVLLPGKSQGQGSLGGCHLWGHTESDPTEWLHFHFPLSCIVEGNGNPLQCSCLESPRDRWAWWAAVYGVAQSRTRLTWLSSIDRIIQYIDFWVGFFHSHNTPRIHPCCWVSVIHSFLLFSNSIEFYGYTTVCLSIHQVMDIWDV